MEEDEREEIGHCLAEGVQSIDIGDAAPEEVPLRRIGSGQVRWTRPKLDLVLKDPGHDQLQDQEQAQESRLTWAYTQAKRLFDPVGLTGFEPATP
ncbi:hypothetical protein [Amycolatopsis vastitatis]|uniref:hypothetical protein n=1 Tax=Amycolatopsis vastitatis TaxID=1905142 RepID=UPI0011778B7B|nr:hypothetical protein [Amycolatopsis vastitatis]